MSKILGFWSEAAKYGWGVWNEDTWLWFTARALPWFNPSAAKPIEGMGRLECIVLWAHKAATDEGAERRYWAGPWEQRYDSYLVFASLAMTPYPLEERWNRFCAGMCRFHNEGFGPTHNDVARMKATSSTLEAVRIAEAAEEVMRGRT